MTHTEIVANPLPGLKVCVVYNETTGLFDAWGYISQNLRGIVPDPAYSVYGISTPEDAIFQIVEERRSDTMRDLNRVLGRKTT